LTFTTLLARAGHLLALVLVPQLPSPEPLGDATTAGILLGVLAVFLPPAVAIWMARSYGSFESKVAVGAWILASCALLYGASGPMTHVPLLASYYTTAPFVWIALAMTAATLAGQHLGSTFRNKKMGAGLIVIAVGVFIYRDARKLVASPTEQWLDVLAREPADAHAWAEVRPALASDAEKFERAVAACLERRPHACHCRVERASSRLVVRDPMGALQELGKAACAPDDTRALRVHARAAALGLPAGDAEKLVDAAIAAHPDDPNLLGARAIVLDRMGRAPEALPIAQQAVDAGAGFDTKLLLGSLQIKAGNLDAAETVLHGLSVEHPENADITYNLALIADRKGKYNEAREGYLKTLRLRADYADARLNLVYLTKRGGFLDEAKSHARRFHEAFPSDPRGKELSALVGSN
jgi:Flp pilus assembly protein TadD